MNEKYEKIIDMPHPVSKNYPRMPKNERSAQFAPYAALSGYDAVVKETARLTSRRISLDEYEIEELNRKMLEMSENIGTGSYFITYFVPDERKAGGEYVREACGIKQVDTVEGLLLTLSGKAIPIREIINIEEIKDEP